MVYFLSGPPCLSFEEIQQDLQSPPTNPTVSYTVKAAYSAKLPGFSDVTVLLLMGSLTKSSLIGLQNILRVGTRATRSLHSTCFRILNYVPQGCDFFIFP